MIDHLSPFRLASTNPDSPINPDPHYLALYRLNLQYLLIPYNVPALGTCMAQIMSTGFDNPLNEVESILLD